MAEKSKLEIILEFVKTFIWPLLVVVGIFWLGPDVKDMLKSRTWKIGILEVGDRVSNLENTLQDELLQQQDYLDQILADPTDAVQVQTYAARAKEAIANAREGVRKEVRHIRETIPEQRPAEPAPDARDSATKENPATAKEWRAPRVRTAFRKGRSSGHRGLFRGPENLAGLSQRFRNQVAAGAQAGCAEAARWCRVGAALS